MKTPNDGTVLQVPRKTPGALRVYCVRNGRWNVAVGTRWFICDPYVTDILNVAAHWRGLWYRDVQHTDAPNDNLTDGAR